MNKDEKPIEERIFTKEERQLFSLIYKREKAAMKKGFLIGIFIGIILDNKIPTKAIVIKIKTPSIASKGLTLKPTKFPTNVKIPVIISINKLDVNGILF